MGIFGRKMNGLDRIGAEVEGGICELVSCDVAEPRRQIANHSNDSESVINNLGLLLQRVSINSVNEIDELISELKILREQLQHDGERMAREIVGYASLSQAAMQSTKILTDGQHLLIGRHGAARTASRRFLSSADDIRRRAARRRAVRRCAHTSHRSRQGRPAAARRRSSMLRHGRGVRQRIALLRQPGAGQEEAALVGKMRIERVPLNAGALGHHADGGAAPGRRCRAARRRLRRCAAGSPPAARRAA